MIISSIEKYDGTLLHHRFAYQYFRDQVSAYGNIIAFRSPMQVLADGMIDQEDALNEAFIYSDDALNFMWEIPCLGNNAFGAVAYQRLLNCEIAEILASADFMNTALTMRGDDIMAEQGKCSVSITHIKDGAALGHTGINIVAGDKAPEFACSTHLTDIQVTAFAQQVIQRFDELNRELFVATSKIIAK